MFKIRKPDAETAREYEAAQALYYKHLATFDHRRSRDLWKFFGYDFFHDGVIGKIEFFPSMSELTIAMSCPNIRQLDSVGGYRYINADFVCKFHGVRRFLMHYEDGEDNGRPDSCAQFMRSEINTNLPEQEEGDELQLDSLLISMIHGDRQAWIDMVFSGVEVIPKEPLALALMEADPQFKLPLYSAESCPG